MQRRRAFTMMELMFVIGIIAVLIALLLPAIQSSRESARRTQCASNLMQLGIAMGNYASTHSVYPPGVVNETGPIVNLANGYHHNWAVQILPFIGQNNVYRRIDFGQSVYAPDNASVFGTKIATFMCPSDARAPMTSYAGCHHDLDAAINVDNHGVLYLNSRVRFDDIPDGSARTILLGEMRGGGPSLGWASGTRSTLRNTGVPLNALDALTTAPVKQPAPGTQRPGSEEYAEIADLADDGLWPLERTGGFSSWHSGAANFLFCDGSVRPINPSIAPPIYHPPANPTPPHP